MILIVLTFLGLAFGSFVNALVWRLHEQGKSKKKRAASDSELSIVSGRSMCPHCKHTLAWYDLIPVFSWLSVAGKCRYCRKPISWQYPLVEMSTATLFALSYIFWPADLSQNQAVVAFVTWLISLVGLVALIIYDTKWMLLPNRIVFPLTTLTVIGMIIQIIIAPNHLSVLLNALGAVSVSAGIFYVLFQISEGRWIGGGDVKLGVALGLLLGTPMLGFLMLFAASLIGIIASLPPILVRKSSFTSKIPFGPFLITATFLVVLFGQAIIDWYSDIFLYL